MKGRRSPARCRLPLLLSLGLIGCSNVQPVETVTLLNYQHCQGLKAGIVETTLDRINSLRRSRLLRPPKDAPVRPEQNFPALGSTRIFAISKGTQPTPGYAFAEPTATLDAGTLTLRLLWQTPAPDAVLPQVTTHPCIVVGIPNADATLLVAEDQNGELGRLPLDL